MNYRYRVALFASTLVVAALSLSSLDAQGRGRRPRGGFGQVGGFQRTVDKARLLAVDEVQTELGLDDSQKKKIADLLSAHRERSRALDGGRGTPSDEDSADRQTQRDAVRAALEKDLEKVLDQGGQRRRLTEILIQQTPADALVDAAVVAELKLSDDQFERVKASIAWGREEQSKLFGRFGGGRGRARRDQPPGTREGGFPNFVEMRQRREKLTKDVEARALAALSDAQKQSFKSLKGEPFELDLRSVLRRRGGRGGGRDFGLGDSSERLNPEKVEFRDGTSNIPDRATFNKLSYQGAEVLIDTHLDGLQFVKFQIEDVDTEQPLLYFINTKTHRAHMRFMRAVGIGRGGQGQMRGVLVYRPLLKAPCGKTGLYTFEFEPRDSFPFEMVKIAHDLLSTKMPVLRRRIGYYPLGPAIARHDREKEQYTASQIPVFLDKDLYRDIGYLPLNQSETYGRLRLMKLDERPSSRDEQPSPRDVVIYKTLPNEMPRVSGVITAVRQTPLSHVNLRAIQDNAPNAFITSAWEDESIAALIGKYVYYKVAADTFELREATPQKVESHFDSLRPEDPQVPKRDLSVTKIRRLDDIKFGDASSFGVKTTNLATLRTFGLPQGSVPDGAGIPFHFYDAFMKHNGFYKKMAELLKDPAFQKDRVKREAELASFQGFIRDGDAPDWMTQALGDLQKSFPTGQAIRCRSSTNNEDLPGFSGAGLYDSYTHDPDEGHLSSSIKQVYASLWNFRAFEEREFYRIDHLATAMGVLVHPNFKGELANGVAVTDDVLYQTKGNYYLNAQVGENLVTNPDEQSIPEEILLDWWDSSRYRIVRKSNRATDGGRILTDDHLGKLRTYLTKIHGKFCPLYGFSLGDEKFALEIEFKITNKGVVSIKQARPWVY